MARSRATLRAVLGFALLAGSAPAAVVQVDVSSLFDADVVVNDGNGGFLDPTQSPIDSGTFDTGNFAFPTRSVAVRLAQPTETPNGIPDDAFFPGNGFHPDVELGWSNDDDGNNARRLWFATGTFTVAVPPGAYSQLHLLMTAGDGNADVTVTLAYSDLTTASFPLLVPDWFDDPAETPSAYRLIDGGDRIQPGSGPGTPFLYQDRNDPAIFGFRLAPDPAKTLQSATIDRTDDLGVLNFFGATAVTAEDPDLYESAVSADPAILLQPGNLVAAGVLSPHLHRPNTPAAPLLFYQVNDGTGSPPLLQAVKRALDLQFTF